jgi:hypothetical protein
MQTRHVSVYVFSNRKNDGKERLQDMHAQCTPSSRTKIDLENVCEIAGWRLEGDYRKNCGWKILLGVTNGPQVSYAYLLSQQQHDVFFSTCVHVLHEQLGVLFYCLFSTCSPHVCVHLHFVCVSSLFWTLS